MRTNRPVNNLLLVLGCVLAVLSVSCGAHDSVSPNPQAKNTASEEPDTRYRVGDFIVYRYSGSHLAGPVRLAEEVIEQDGNHLKILVSASRGEETRAWVQVLTDTPENQKNEVIDALFEVVNGEWVPLETQEVYRLYDWVLPPEGDAPFDSAKLEKELDIAGVKLSARCSAWSSHIGGAVAKSEYCQSDQLLWTNAAFEILDEVTGESLYRMEILETGHR